MFEYMDGIVDAVEEIGQAAVDVAVFVTICTAKAVLIITAPVCKDGRNHRKGSIYHCGSESRTGRKCWLGTLEEWRRLD